MTTHDEPRAEFSSLELAARRMISAYRRQLLLDDNISLFSAKQAVLNTFTAMWSASMSLEHICAVSVAMSNMTIPSEDIQSVLTTMVRAKLLRSRVTNGTRRYEVNFK
jgi:hypothetical protein